MVIEELSPWVKGRCSMTRQGTLGGARPEHFHTRADDPCTAAHNSGKTSIPALNPLRRTAPEATHANFPKQEWLLRLTAKSATPFSHLEFRLGTPTLRGLRWQRVLPAAVVVRRVRGRFPGSKEHPGTETMAQRHGCETPRTNVNHNFAEIDGSSERAERLQL